KRKSMLWKLIAVSTKSYPPNGMARRGGPLIWQQHGMMRLTIGGPNVQVVILPASSRTGYAGKKTAYSVKPVMVPAAYTQMKPMTRAEASMNRKWKQSAPLST